MQKFSRPWHQLKRYSALGSCVSLWNLDTIRGSLITPKWQKLASLAQEICTLWFHFFGAVFVSKGYYLKNIFPSEPNIHEGPEYELSIHGEKFYQFHIESTTAIATSI